MKNQLKTLRYIFLTCFCFTLQTNISSAQANDVHIHFDKSFYVAGEVAWYTLYLPVKYLDQEIAINTTLVDGNGRQRDRFFLRSEGKTCVSGYYKFPYEVSAGIFEIQFRVTKGGDNPDELLATFPVPVYNDLANLSNIEVQEARPSQLESRSGDFEIRVEVSDQINPRSESSVIIKVLDNAGQPAIGKLSVSITDEHLCGSGSTNFPTVQTVESVVDGVSDLKNYAYIQGRLGTIEEPQQVNVLGGYIGVDDKIYYTKSFDDGFFSMKLPEFEGPKMIQFIGYQFERAEVSASVDRATSMMGNQPVIYTDGILEYLKYSRMRKKIQQYFEQEEMPLDLPRIRNEVVEKKPDLTFNIKEYESFPDMRGFFGEIITTLNFKLGEDSLYTASLYNPKERRSKNTNLKGPPLFIIDGKMTRNADFVAKMSMVPIETIEIYTDAEDIRDKYSAIGISGIVKIKTSLQDVTLDPADAEDVHMSYGFQQPAVFPNLDVQNNKRHPLIRPQIYWNPSLVVDAGGEAAFNFIQSDDSGDFSVEIFFQAEDGRTAYARSNYMVKS